jgi:predicted DsbA family dithiol-disulfide isomerase
MDAGQTEAFLLSNEGIQEIRELERQAIARGVRSVPTIRIGNEVLFGAQPIDVLLTTLQKAIRELEIANR